MNSRVAATTGIWRARAPRGTADRAYVAYALVMSALIIGAPVVRAAWLALTVPAAAAGLVAPHAPVIAAVVELAMLATTLIVGRNRGPAVAPPFLAYTLTSSELPGRVAFRQRTIIAVVSLAVTGAAFAGFVGAVTVAVGIVPVAAAVDFAVRGLLMGTMVAVCWLVGEAHPRTAGALAAALLLVAALVAVTGSGAGAVGVPSVEHAWVSPTVDLSGTLVLGLIAVLGVAAAPLFLDAITPATITTQSGRWDSAIAHAVSLDFGSAAESYQALPSRGRRIQAVVHGAGPVVLVVVRDAVGSVRTPARFLGAIIAASFAGFLLFVAAQDRAAAPLLGAVTAGLLYSATGAFTRGLHHVARVSRDQPLFGIGEGVLVLLHSVFPVVLTTVVTAGSVVVVHAVVDPSVPVANLWAAFAFPIIVMAARVSNSLRGPAPLFLMTPAPSAVGDPMPLLRVLWALDAPLLAVLAGVAAASGSVASLVAVALVLAVFLLVRWRRRS